MLQGLDILFKIGLTCNPRTLALKMKDLGKNHDMELIQWKSRLELKNELSGPMTLLEKSSQVFPTFQNYHQRMTSDVTLNSLKLVKPWYHVLQIVHSYLPLMLIA